MVETVHFPKMLFLCTTPSVNKTKILRILAVKAFLTKFYSFIFYNSDKDGSTKASYMKTIFKEISIANLCIPLISDK